MYICLMLPFVIKLNQLTILAFIFITGTFISFAIDWLTKVFPTPFGPYSKIPTDLDKSKK